MAYVLEVISKDGKIKYINSAKATVYCPEYAARYDDKKTAMTVAAALLRNECYRSISVKKLSLELCVASYKRNRSLSFNLIYPNIYIRVAATNKTAVLSAFSAEKTHAVKNYERLHLCTNFPVTKMTSRFSA